MSYTATYSPDDNKLRLYSTARLDAETYAEAKRLGFRWAPKQDLFFAPAWTPAREDFLTKLAGEVGDEDTSLVDRAEARAERFEDYSDKMMAEAKRAREAVAAIADNIPFGQPILVGHHSEKRARRDAEKIQNGMRRAVRLWETSGYWKARAEGALRHAKYKELPGVRHRRIKTLEAERRKIAKNKAEAETWLKLWTACGDEPDADLQMAAAKRIADVCWLHLPRKEGDREDFSYTPTAYDALNNSHPTLYAPRTLDEVVGHAKKVYPATIAHCERWLAHYDNRLAYERAMLDEQIGASGELGPGMGGRFDIKPGGKVLVGRDGWLTVIRVNKSGGAINSVTTAAPMVVNWQRTWKYGIEKVIDYQPPTPAGMMKKHHVYLTDAKRVDPPKLEPKNDDQGMGDAKSGGTPSARGGGNLAASAGGVPAQNLQLEPRSQADEGGAFEAMRQSLKAGVKVVAAPQLFPTPADVAAKLAGLAGIQFGDRVLEPSAGTGALIEAVGRVAELEAVERNLDLCAMLRKKAYPPSVHVRCGDFLELGDADIGTFDKIVMNPPFERGSDIKHVEHALTFLRPGGRLAAIVADGPRQREKLMNRATHWEELPEGTFAGTGVRAAICVIDN